MTSPIKSFSGDYEFLSNFYPSRVTLDGIEYRTIEHAFQAAKTLDPNERERVRSKMTPGKAKAAGRTVNLRPDWEEIKVSVMEGLLRQKFAPDTILAAALAVTYPHELVEGNTWHDNFWGVDTRTPEKGKNNLGLLLMKIRSELFYAR